MQCFFDFFIPLSSKTPSFENFLGRLSARNALKTRCFSWEGYQKVRKTSRDSSDCKKTHGKVSGRENIDCENTMKMNIENRKTPDQPPQRVHVRACMCVSLQCVLELRLLACVSLCSVCWSYVSLQCVHIIMSLWLKVLCRCGADNETRLELCRFGADSVTRFCSLGSL